MHRFSFGLVVLLLAATPAAAAINYSFRNRQVATSTGPADSPGTSDLEDTAATGFWSAEATSAYGTDPPSCSAGAACSQISNLGDFEISMSGDLGAASSAFPFPGCVGIAKSFLGASFTLDSDVRYISALDDNGGVIANFAFQEAGGSVSYDANSSGILPAGTYSLSILFQVTANEFGGTAGGLYTYSLTLVPEPSSVCLMLVGAALATFRRRPKD